MPWPKGKLYSKEHIAKRTASLLISGGKRRLSKIINGVQYYLCPSCKKYIPINDFHIDKRSWNGIKNQCKKCHGVSSVRSRNLINTRRLGRESEARRRAKLANVKITILPSDIKAIEASWGNRCLKCGSENNLQWDHVKPISIGGEHCISNLQRLCRKCNECKQARFYDYRTEAQKLWVIEFKRINDFNASRKG